MRRPSPGPGRRWTLTRSDPGAAGRADARRRTAHVHMRWRNHRTGPGRDEPLPRRRALARLSSADFHPHRDDRFAGQYQFEFPPHVVYNDPRVPADERNLALLCKRTLEMDAGNDGVHHGRANRAPWDFQLDFSRQLWDEMRHAMMGSVALEARGVEWTGIPLNVGFALRLNLHATPLERQIMLYAIEQSLMPAETGKRFEYATAQEAGDALSARSSTIMGRRGAARAHRPPLALARRDRAGSGPEAAQTIHDRPRRRWSGTRTGEPAVDCGMRGAPRC